MREENYNSYSEHSTIVSPEEEETDYLVQGSIDDPLFMHRNVNDLLECERDNVQKRMLEE